MSFRSILNFTLTTSSSSPFAISLVCHAKVCLPSHLGSCTLVLRYDLSNISYWIWYVFSVRLKRGSHKTSSYVQGHTHSHYASPQLLFENLHTPEFFQTSSGLFSSPETVLWLSFKLSLCLYNFLKV